MKSLVEKIFSNFRYKITFALFMFFYLICLYQLFNIQIVKKEEYALAANAQYVKNIQDTFNRGKIYFSKYKDDNVLVADTIDRKVDRNGKEIILRDRVYPLASLGAKAVGFVAYDENDRVGRYGIEKYYNDVLARDSDKLYTNFFAEIFGDIKGSLTNEKPTYEGDINLTIDIEMQKYLSATLEETRKVWNSDKIGGVIMDINDGRIVAMEELPTFNPNKFIDVTDASLYKNDMVTGVYEMGSIIKPLTMAAALDAGVVDENTFYNDVGMRMLNGYPVKNYDSKARGWSNIQLILDKSLNVGIVFLVEKLGVEKFQEYFKKFAFGYETGIDLPNEVSGLTKNLDSKIFVDSATAGFGQGIAITPMQTVRALASLGNGGKLVNPYIVDSIKYKNGLEKKIIPDEATQILVSDTSSRITKMLVHVVDTSLGNGKYKMKNYAVAAKTGTAQVAKPNGGYYDDRYLHSIFAYFPAYQPRYIIFMYHTNPKGAEYASQTLSEPLFKLIDFVISYYQIGPDR
jgi:cell division protein FtsI (penicillin-binding protein 3)/stage V sporulation protein D (sporulation-specific penicillin-binding protein)